METSAPTFGRIAIAAGFALSCFGLLLFLWLAFGGPVPLKPKSYRVDMRFDEATQLAVESDVRISGVSVGKVKAIELSDDGLADATIEIQPKYAPIPVNTQAILRQKTLLGETYVELTPGDAEDEMIPEGGDLNPAQVSDAVQLDEIFRAFDEPTRDAFRAWMVDAAGSLRGRGADLNAALGNLSPFAAERRRPAAHPRHPAPRGRPADRRRRPDLRRDQRAARRAARADREHRVGLLDDGGAQRGAAGDLQGAADVPQRVRPDPAAARALRDRHRSAGHPAAPGRARVQRHLPRAARRLARPRAVLHRAAPRDPPRPERVRRPAHDPRRRPAAGARPGRLLLRRADPGRRRRSTATSGRSRRSSATSPPPPTARASRAARTSRSSSYAAPARSTFPRSPRRRRRTRSPASTPTVRRRARPSWVRASRASSPPSARAGCRRPSTDPATSPRTCGSGSSSSPSGARATWRPTRFPRRRAATRRRSRRSAVRRTSRPTTRT